MKSLRTFAVFVATALLLKSSVALLAFGPEGHGLVGAIADHILDGTPTGTRVSELLDGLSLEEAANLPDQIKTWDGSGHFGLPRHPLLAGELHAFWEANHAVDPATGEMVHHVYHYTDVPIEDTTYAQGTRGRSQLDIVHMIPYCIQVLKGTVPETNDRKITKTVAVILLSHYLGDIHQPLHVGAEYFDNGQPVNGDDVAAALPDEGGNTISVNLADEARSLKLHGFWDKQAVAQATSQLADQLQIAGDSPDREIAIALGDTQPDGWHAPQGDVLSWAEKWADEILPLAREAHTRLKFDQMRPGVSHGRPVEVVRASELPAAHNAPSYESWAGKVTARQIHLAGWRLVAVLQAALQ